MTTAARSKITILTILLAAATLDTMAQQVTTYRQRHFPRTVPAGNYSGITWLGGDRYAVANDKSVTAGFHLMTIKTDSTTGDILEVRADSFVTSHQSNRDEEGICYVPQTNTVFVSGEADGQIIEYRMDGQLTGRRLSIPDMFATARSNHGFEALTYNATTHRFWTTTENSLPADGAQPTILQKTANCLRLQSFDDSLQPQEQYCYITDTLSASGQKGQCTLGVSGMAALDDGRIIVLEREIRRKRKIIGSYVHVRLYTINPASRPSGEILKKQLLAEFRTKVNLTNHGLANYEGLCLGPKLPDGQQTLILVADSQNQYKGILKDWFRSIVIRAGSDAQYP